MNKQKPLTRLNINSMYEVARKIQEIRWMQEND